jgi:hypothetical protein
MTTVATAMAGGTDNNQLKLAARHSGGGNSDGNSSHGRSNDCRGRANDCPRHRCRRNCLCHRLGGLWVLVVMVLCGVVRAGCVCVLEEEVPTELKALLTLTDTLTSLLKHTTEDPAPGCLSRRRIVKMIYFKL